MAPSSSSSISHDEERQPSLTKSALANNLKHFTSGLIGGSVSAVVLQPADLLKTRVQQSHTTTLLFTIRAILSGPKPISTLWRGAIPSAIRTGLGSGVYFTSLDALRRTITTTSYLASSSSSSPSPHPAKASPLTNLLTGATARVFAGFLMMPITVIKVRYESTFYNYTSLLNAFSDILKHEGPRGFFKGFGATAIRDAPYAGFYVTFYEGAKGVFGKLFVNSNDYVEGLNIKTSTTTLINLSSGLTAGALATAVTNPFDALKTRIQLFPGVYKNLWVAGRKIVSEEGVIALFDGLGLRMGRKALSSAVAWTAYEEGMRRWAVAAKKDNDEEK